ncbi:hypothetical protein B0I35DRAFT_151502 [Stachybotrys elegans]|uniref:Heterokaryon incompatibility domain-containing protein n=1 Tax=Stachybotrys elegans TaxID=80388 RepID=A0A8K0SEH0_9HYPO|nr:hypothetical protein B0I35DRAFT_151502 [Stachybotrys elegans]
MDVFMSLLGDEKRALRAPYFGPPANESDAPLGVSDKSSFADYPRQAGFDFWIVGQGLAPGRNVAVDDLSRFLQNWLFFRLLTDFFGVYIDPANFVEYGQIKATPTALRNAYDNYEERILYNEAAGLPWKRLNLMMAEEERTRMLLDLARREHDLISTTIDSDMPMAGAILDFAKVSLSVSLLIDCLADIHLGFHPQTRSLVHRMYFWAFTRAQRMKSAPQYFREHNTTLPFGARKARIDVRLLLDVFERNGWCPVRAQQMCSTFRPRTCNYLSFITRQDVHPGGHTHCKGKPRCIAFNIDESTYSMSHSGNCNDEVNCTSVCIPTEDVNRFIEDGCIPLVSINASGDLDPKLVPFDANQGYTAISHVWSDGLGNPNDNSLMECQLLSLRDSVLLARCRSPVTIWTRLGATLGHKPYFPLHERSDRLLLWIDSLCIPARHSTSEEKRFKAKAIKLIVAVFAGANRIAIREAGLQRQSCRVADDPIPALELLGFVTASKWTERAWTMEESCVATIQSVEMRNGAVLLPSLSALRRLDWGCDFERKLEGVILQNLRRAFDFSLYGRQKSIFYPGAYREKAEARFFASVWNDLSQRTMTKEHDGPIILANLMDMNTTELLKAPKCERLPLVIRNCYVLPLSLLYSASGSYDGDGITTTKNAEGWLPLSITTELLHPNPYMTPYKLFNGDTGLLCNGWGYDDKIHLLELHTAGIASGSSFSVVVKCLSDQNDGAQNEYVVELVTHAHDTSSTHPLGLVDSGENYPDRLCLVLDEHISSISRTGIRARGAIFDIMKREENLPFYLGTLSLRFRAAITARTPEQWRFSRYNGSMPPKVGNELLAHRSYFIKISRGKQVFFQLG